MTDAQNPCQVTIENNLSRLAIVVCQDEKQDEMQDEIQCKHVLQPGETLTFQVNAGSKIWSPSPYSNVHCSDYICDSTSPKLGMTVDWLQKYCMGYYGLDYRD